jgi:magnesium transporter
MTVAAAFLYRDGKRIRPVSIEEKVELDEKEPEFVWIGVADPSAVEMRALQERYGLHPLAVEDAIKADQLPKVDIYGEQLFVVARTAHLEADRITSGETAIFAGRNHIISVRHGSSRDHSPLREHLEETPTLLVQGVDYVLHAILDFIVDGYFPVVERIEEDVLTMEHRAIEGFLGRDDVKRIFSLRRELIRFHRILGPMAEVAGKLIRLDVPCIDAESKPYFGDVLDHVRRVQTRVDALHEILRSVFELSNLLEQQRTGAITRQLAAWAAILAVPTAIAGIYGMNFEHMPELETTYGYFVVVGAMAIICSALYLRFKLAKWL